jgi:hypothetical protein
MLGDSIGVTGEWLADTVCGAFPGSELGCLFLADPLPAPQKIQISAPSQNVLS